jgi:adenylate cyclase
MYLSKRRYDESAAEVERAIALLAPGTAFGNFWVAFTLSRSGKPTESLAYVEKAERLDPQSRGFYEFERGVDYFDLGRYQEAAAVLQAHLVSWPNNLTAHLLLAAAYIELNRQEEARAQAAEVMRISPHFSIEGQKKISPFKDQAIMERWAADMHKAGLK